EASLESTNSFIKENKRQPSYESEQHYNTNNKLKYDGYLRALKEANISIDEQYIVTGNYSYQSGIDAIKELLSLENKPHAVFAASDEMALGVIHGAQDMGYRVPNDIEVFGFDNTRLAQMVRPTLSTIVQPMYDIGAVAMRLLTKFMNKEEVDERKVILPHRIEKRSSTK